MSSAKYHEGRFNDLYDKLDEHEKKRCKGIMLLGMDRVKKICSPAAQITLLPKHIEFFFGAKNVRAVFDNGTQTHLDIWLDIDDTELKRIVGKLEPKLIGFCGPEGAILYVLFAKDAYL